MLLTFMEGQLNEYKYRAAVLIDLINNLKAIPVVEEPPRNVGFYSYDIQFSPIDLSFLD